MLHRLEYIVLGVAGIEILFGKADSTYAIFNCRENRERMVTLLHMLLAEADRSSGRLRDRLSGPAGGTADLAGAVHHAFRCSWRRLPRTENRECAEIKRYLDTNYREDISLDTCWQNSPTSTNTIWPTPSSGSTASLPSLT